MYHEQGQRHARRHLRRHPPQYRDAAHHHLARGKQFLSEEYFPEERRGQFINRGKKVRKWCLLCTIFTFSLLILLRL